MALSNELISQFVKVTTSDKTNRVTEATVYGTVVVDGNKTYVQFDGSGQITPVSTLVKVEDGDRVTVLIKDHTATVTGNLSSPSASVDDVVEVGQQVTKFEEVLATKVSTEELNAEIARIETLEADNVTIHESLNAANASIGDLKADVAEIDQAKISKLEAESIVTDAITAEIAKLDYVETNELEATNARIHTLETTYLDVTGRLTASEADIDNLTADNVTIKESLTVTEASIERLDATIANFDYVETKDLEATNAKITELEAENATIKGSLTAAEANIGKLETDKLSATDADLKYANIDFTNIGEAAIEQFFSKSGMIEDLVVGDGTVTGNLVGVTIKGDIIEGNTIVADKLVVRGDDGLYYKLNFEGGTFTDGEEIPRDSLHGSVITAKSITAEKVSVNDLVAFGATIGGFNITQDSLYSGVKESIDNTTRGIYMDDEGQFSLGDSTNYLKYYKVVNDDGSESWKLAIALESLLFGLNSKSSGQDLANLLEHIRIGTYLNPETGNDEPSIEMFENDTDFKMRITNTHASFTDGSSNGTSISTEAVESDNVTARDQLLVGKGHWVWKERANGNIGLQWKEVVE